ncbi:hypothetical protein ALI22I_14390 [Saccharothrix sp. ALI-22-I]|nr:hypothetical protein ALI22I_14390 [Saccharothrix sp. ALI-22-I]
MTSTSAAASARPTGLTTREDSDWAMCFPPLRLTAVLRREACGMARASAIVHVCGEYDVTHYSQVFYLMATL